MCGFKGKNHKTELLDLHDVQNCPRTPKISPLVKKMAILGFWPFQWGIVANLKAKIAETHKSELLDLHDMQKYRRTQKISTLGPKLAILGFWPFQWGIGPTLLWPLWQLSLVDPPQIWSWHLLLFRSGPWGPILGLLDPPFIPLFNLLNSGYTANVCSHVTSPLHLKRCSLSLSKLIVVDWYLRYFITTTLQLFYS